MGVPAFYRWLSEKYPKIIQDVLEERVHLASDSGSIRMPFDATKSNPSGLEADNLYIDMNGIIHPCSHPEHGPQPNNEQEMYENVCLYIDRLMRAVRPRKLLYLAIDGVAPRAKMNQQRARRFRSAQEARERAETEMQVRASLEEQGNKVPPRSEKPWDSNVITPGTKFMIDLSEYVRFYIRRRIATDDAWKKIKVLISDASIPGEGEHKIMAHVRQQRGQKGYNPNLVHVLHGLDADLIMLALATHEAHFYILREEVLFGRKSAEATEQRRNETGFTFQQKLLDEAAGSAAMELPENSNKPLQRLSIPILREYLANEFASCLNPPFQGEVSFERLIDDVVFMCFFVGNDFLPHLPSLDIRDGALDYLFNVYRRLLPGLGGYLTDHGGRVNLERVDVILAEVGAIEDYVFEMKHRNELQEKQRKEYHRKKGMHAGKLPAGGILNAPQENFQKMGRAARIMTENEGGAVNRGMNSSDGDIKLQRGHSAKEDLRKKLKSKATADDNANAAEALKRSLVSRSSNDQPDGKPTEEKKHKYDEFGRKMVTVDNTMLLAEIREAKRKASQISAPGSRENSDIDDEMFGSSSEDGSVKSGDVDVADEDEDEDDSEEDQAALDEATKQMKDKIKAVESTKLDEYAKNVKDNVRLHEPGWKDRYYTDKCKADDVENHGGREHLFRSYVKGLCWVMKYYYDGVPSWKWYFPFHYAPFASDLRNIERFQKDCDEFELAEPFKPVEQLLAVLPEDSAHAVPKEARWLMGDEESPIIDFYPKDVPCDPNGKAMPWLWVVLLPFIDEERLLAALHPTMKKWTQNELLCNARGLDDGYVFYHKNHPLSSETSFILNSGAEYVQKKFCLCDIEASRISCLFGFLRKPLSHELLDFDENSIVPLPATASEISRTTEMFANPIEPNEAICFAFTEPSIDGHKSVILPGAVPPPSILTESDRQIRRPRLNRGGDTIANLGAGNSSHKAGYGSMNISSYERDLAMRTGRGRQMNQAGTRAWGAMEPTPKRHHGPNHHTSGSHLPTVQRWQVPPHFPPPPPQPPQMWQPPPGRPPSNQQPNQYQQGAQHQYAMNNGAYNQKSLSGISYNTQQHQTTGNPQSRYQQHQQQYSFGQQNRVQQQGYSHAIQRNQQQNQGRGGYSLNQQGQQLQPQQQQQQHGSFAFSNIQRTQQAQQQPSASGRANLTNLRAQLMSTLQKNRNKGN
mmetsp:Transcript_28765/g.59276  ORF Transcript_28765/g.59276 Transcript_28765/m.59276 type:complete len:1202 (+) Transcript_28765:161-3766(+)